jgi:hypothetical protein
MLNRESAELYVSELRPNVQRIGRVVGKVSRLGAEALSVVQKSGVRNLEQREDRSCPSRSFRILS